MKSQLNSQSSSVYSTTHQDQQTVRVKSRTNEQLDITFDDSSPTNIQLHISDSAHVHLDIKTASPIDGQTILECFLSKGSQLQISESYTHSINLNLRIHLIEPYASVSVQTRFQAEDSHKIYLTQEVFHRVGFTHADLEARGIVDDTAKVSVDTTLRVDPKSKGCTSLQSLSGLQLSKSASIRAVPRLEIHNADVMTKHGVSIRTIRPEEVWYLATKGLTQSQARDTIQAGFISKL